MHRGKKRVFFFSGYFKYFQFKNLRYNEKAGRQELKRVCTA